MANKNAKCSIFFLIILRKYYKIRKIFQLIGQWACMFVNTAESQLGPWRWPYRVKNELFNKVS